MKHFTSIILLTFLTCILSRVHYGKFDEENSHEKKDSNINKFFDSQHSNFGKPINGTNYFGSYSTSKSFSSSTKNGITKESGMLTEQIKTQKGNSKMKIRKYAEKYNKDQKDRLLYKKAKSNIDSEQKYFENDPEKSNLSKTQADVIV